MDYVRIIQFCFYTLENTFIFNVVYYTLYLYQIWSKILIFIKFLLTDFNPFHYRISHMLILWLLNFQKYSAPSLYSNGHSHVFLYLCERWGFLSGPETLFISVKYLFLWEPTIVRVFQRLYLLVTEETVITCSSWPLLMVPLEFGPMTQCFPTKPTTLPTKHTYLTNAISTDLCRNRKWCNW